MTEPVGEIPGANGQETRRRTPIRSRPLYRRLVSAPIQRVRPEPGMPGRIATRMHPNNGERSPFLADEIREMELPTVSVDALQGSDRIPPLPREQQPDQQTIDVQQYSADEAALLTRNREHLTRNERRTEQNIRERRFQRPDLGPDDPAAYEQWHQAAIAAIRDDPTANIFLEQTEPQAAPAAPQPGERAQQQNVNISPEHPGRFTYTRAGEPLPEGRLHGQISEVGLNNHGELVLMFADGQVSLLNNRFNTYRPGEGRVAGLPFSITGIRTVNGETMVDFLARGTVVRERSSVPLDTFLTNLNSGRVVLHEGYPLHIGPLRNLNVIETDTPASQAVPGLLPFDFRSSVPGIITDPVTHIGVDAQGELVIRHNTETVWKGNPRGSILGRTILYRDPNSADAYVRLQVANVSRQDNQTIIQFTDRSGNAITVPAGELLNSINNGTDVDRWQIDRNPNRPINGGVLAPEPPPVSPENQLNTTDQAILAQIQTMYTGEQAAIDDLTRLVRSHTLHGPNNETRVTIDGVTYTLLSPDQSPQVDEFVQLLPDGTQFQPGTTYPSYPIEGYLAALQPRLQPGMLVDWFGTVDTTADPQIETFVPNPPTRWEISDERIRNYVPTTQVPFLLTNPEGSGTFASPIAAGFAYDNPQDAIENGQVMQNLLPNIFNRSTPSYALGEAADNFRSGLFALMKESAPTPEAQAILFRTVGNVMLDILSRPEGTHIMQEWLTAQGTLDATRALSGNNDPTRSSLDWFFRYDHNLINNTWEPKSPEEQMLGYAPDGTYDQNRTYALWRDRLTTLREQLNSGNSLPTSFLGQMELFAHMFDLPLILRDMSNSQPQPAPTS